MFDPLLSRTTDPDHDPNPNPNPNTNLLLSRTTNHDPGVDRQAGRRYIERVGEQHAPCFYPTLTLSNPGRTPNGLPALTRNGPVMDP